MADSRHLYGSAGEEQALRHCLGLGYELLERNWRCKNGEIDLIFRDGDTIVFMEVKARRSAGEWGDPAEAITVWQQRRIVRASLTYLKSRHLFQCDLRFDAVLIAADSLTHLKAAFPVDMPYFF